MTMFNKQVKNQENELSAQVDQDLVVRNMPRPTLFKGAMNSTFLKGSQQNIIEPKNNVRVVGFIIILAGIIFIGVLVYLSYLFIIKPATKNSPEKTSYVVSTKATSTTISFNNSEDSVVTVSTTTVTETTTPNILDLATSTESNIGVDGTNNSPGSALPPLLDSDSDGLTDNEEMVLGTNLELIDSDADNYTDLAEINGGYDPLSSGQLDISKNINKYINSPIDYELLYPKDWEIQSLNDGRTIIFAAPDGSLIQISVQENSNQQSILGWYENSFSSVTVTYDKLKNSDYWEGIMGEDNLNFYLTDKERQNIYVISYIPAIDGRIAYPNIFQMMINFLVIK